MSVPLSVERDRIQRQVEQLEQRLSVAHTELELLSSETDDGLDDDDTEEEGEQSAAGLLAQREKIQKEIKNLESVLGPHSPISVPDDDDSSSSSSSDESELGLSLSVESCLQMNLVYQQVVQETLDQLETLLTQNQRQQKEVESQLSGPTKESVREQAPPTSCQLPTNMYLGRFLKPYFKDKLTGLGPPANQETKEKSSRMIGCLDNPKLKIKRWSSWQKILLIHSVSRDGLRRLIQPKLSKVDYLSQKLSSAREEDRQQLREQVDRLEREIDLLREKKEEELIGDRYEEHDWQKISNIDFEGTRDAEDISCFWQNFLHPSINKSPWSQEEVQRLKEVSGRHGERCWENIAAELGTGRTAFLCLQTFQRFVSHSLKRSVWTPVEDDLLREMVDKMRIGNFIPYTQISYFMEGRGPTQLIYRWTHFLDPSLKRGPWTPEEDQLLLRAVSLYGEKDWWKIRMEVPGRHDGACRDRYYDSLKAGLKRGGFDKEEQMLLLKLVEKHGVGRWAKIAAEIPDRNDGQCLREWKKLSKAAVHPAQKRKRKPPASQGRTKKEKKRSRRKRRSVRRQRLRLKDEEEAEMKEEEETLVEYMDSDEEEKKKHWRNKKKEVEEVKKVPPSPTSATTLVVEEKEEEEEAYSFPPMEEWAPSGRAPIFPALRFRPVDLPSSSEGVDSSVRSTILGQYGRSVVIGPPPTELPAGRRHSSGHLMMVAPEQLRAHLRHQVDKFNKLTSVPQRGLHSGTLQSAMRNRVMDLELQAAVTPWIGNLLIPRTSRLTAADILRERGEERQLSSTPIFLLLLQTMNVDSAGCKEMIEKRRSKAVFAPSPDSSSVRLKNPKTIAGMLQRKAMGAEPRVLDPQRSLILRQLEKQGVHCQPLRLPGPTHPSFPGMLCQNRPQLLLQTPPHVRPTAMTPRMPPTFFPQTIFVPSPVHPPPPAASICLLTPSSLATPLVAPPVPVTCPLPAPSAPAVPGLAEPQNTESISSTQNIQACSAPPVAPGSTNPQQNTVLSGSVGSTCSIPPRATPNLSSSTQTRPTPSPSSFTWPRPARGRRPKVGKAVGGRQNGALVGGACAESEGGAETVMVDGRRPRRLTEKARALQEAAEIRAECKKRAASCSDVQKISPAPLTDRPAPIQHLCSPSPQDTPPTPAPPPAAIISSLFAPPLSGNSSSGTTVAPPPSVLTDQRAAMSTSGPPNDSFNDHDYTTHHFQPAASQHGPTSIQSCPAHKVTSGSTPKEPSKPPPGRKKRARLGEQLSVKNEHHAGGGGTVGGSVETVGGASGVVPEGKRVRKPSQRARALQEEAQAKVEAKKKRRSSSSPVTKRRCESLAQKEAVLQNQVLAPGAGFCLGPGQSMWVMAPVGFVRLAEAPPQRAQLKPPGSIWNGQLATPLLQPPYPPILPVPVHLPLPPPPASIHKPLLQGVIVPSGPPPASTALPRPPIFLPYKGTIRADPSAPPPLRREPLQFDPSLMFLESRVSVCDWLSGRGGVRVPGAGVSLPYLPPFVSSLSTLSALLCAQKSLTESSMQLLSCCSEAGHPQTESRPDAVATETPSPQSELPDSTSDFTPAPPGRTELLQEEEEAEEEEEKEEEEEEELVVGVRQLVAERFSSNPAYQLLKSRFLSCFTVPALLATVKPIRTKTVTHQTNQEEDEEEDEEEAQLEKIKERGKQRSAERSLLLRVGSRAPANHFSGISHTHTHTAAALRTGPNRTDPKEGGQEEADGVGPVES